MMVRLFSCIPIVLASFSFSGRAGEWPSSDMPSKRVSEDNVSLKFSDFASPRIKYLLFGEDGSLSEARIRYYGDNILVLSVHDADVLRKFKLGLCQAVRPVFVWDEDAEAGSEPIAEMELFFDTKTVVRVWAFSMGFSIVSSARSGSVFYSAKLAYTLDEVLREKGLGGLRSASLKGLSGDFALPPKE